MLGKDWVRVVRVSVVRVRLGVGLVSVRVVRTRLGLGLELV